jgi:hypothetical protein
MNQAVSQKDWVTLVEILDAAINLLRGKNVDPVRLAILHFGNSASMFGLPAVARVASKLDAFLIQHLTPDYEGEPASLLCFAMEGIRAKMKTQSYDQNFSASLEETVAFLEFFSEEDNWPSHTGYALTDEAQVTGTVRETPPSDPSSEIIHALGSLDQFHDSGLLNRPSQTVPESVEPPGKQLPLFGEPTPKQLQMAYRSDASTGPPLGPDRRSGVGEHGATPSLRNMIEDAGRAAAAFKPGDQSADEVTAYKTLLKHDPRSLIFAMLADALCSQGRWAEAVEVCEQGLIFHPQYLRARVLLGWALWELGEPNEAHVVLSGAREELEKNALLYRVLSKIVASEDPQKSEEYLELYRKLQSTREKPASMEHLQAATENAGNESTILFEFLSQLIARFHGKSQSAERKTQLLSAREREYLMDVFRSVIS